jgi:hypothetical protein
LKKIKLHGSATDALNDFCNKIIKEINNGCKSKIIIKHYSAWLGITAMLMVAQ